LKPVSQRRFVESELVVEEWNDVTSAFAHFPRRFGETWLVPIDEWQTPRAREMKQQAPQEENNVIAHCRWYD
jgi:hypothetical protein